ncbi:MAG: hypothetical protein K1X65_10640 [Caldilineales bacterium]|nr:hypothetical protein [Caldilineales bacterium]
MSADLSRGLLLCLIILFGIGWGPALALLRGVHRRSLLALALAPVTALAMTSVLGLPLVMFIGPVSRWAFPLAASLLILSAGLVIWERHRDQALLSDIRLPTLFKWAGVFLVGVAILWAPALVMGGQYTAFRSNPGDSFTYMSLAETVRKVDWDVIRAGSSLTAANLDNITRLAAESPTALYSARFLGRSFPINHVSNLAWLAQLAGVSTQRFYYPFHIILSVMMLPTLVALGFQVNLRRWLLALTALAATVGFWVRLVIETDASAELGATPLLALAVFGWMLVARGSGGESRPSGGESRPSGGESRPSGGESGPEQAGNRWRWRFLTALAWAALAVVYRPFGIIIVGALLLHLVYDLVVLRDGKGWLASYASVAIIALLLLVLTGQVGYYLPGFLNAAGSVEAEMQHEAVTFNVLLADKLGGLTSLPIYQLWRGAPPTISLVLTLILQVAGLALAVFWLFGLLSCLRDRSQNRQRALFFVGLAGVLTFLALWLLQNPKAAGKAYTYVFACIVLGMVIGADRLANRLQAPRRRILLAFLAVWLALVIGVGLLLPFDPVAGGRFARARANRVDYALDLNPITTALNRANPALVLVNVPRDDPFFFAFYVMLALSEHPTYYQSGLIIDGDLSFQNLWLAELDRVPDFILVSKPADYLDGTGLGQVVAETENLRLYEMAAIEMAHPGAGLEWLRQQEAAIRQQEASKPMFPSLVP